MDGSRTPLFERGKRKKTGWEKDPFLTKMYLKLCVKTCSHERWTYAERRPSRTADTVLTTEGERLLL